MREYKIVRGDTLAAIAERKGVTLDRLLEANPTIKNPNRIRAGQWLRIPEKDTNFALLTRTAIARVSAPFLQTLVPALGTTKAFDLASALDGPMTQGAINTPNRVSAFVAQLAHESGGFKWMRELGRASYFKKYEGRVDLGNTQPGDGLKYKGRGFIQITGRYNYTSASKALGMDLVTHPELAEQYPIATLIAVWYWNLNELNTPADTGDEVGFKIITRRINGGLRGYQERLLYWKRSLQYFAEKAETDE